MEGTALTIPIGVNLVLSSLSMRFSYRSGHACSSQAFCGEGRQAAGASLGYISSQQLDLDRDRSHGVSMTSMTARDQENPIVQA
jgi:hypothetical protein